MSSLSHKDKPRRSDSQNIHDEEDDQNTPAVPHGSLASHSESADFQDKMNKFPFTAVSQATSESCDNMLTDSSLTHTQDWSKSPSENRSKLKKSSVKLKGVFTITDFSKYNCLEETKLDDEGDIDKCLDEEPILKEIDCGEPTRDQHLWIDFTPIPGVDDDQVLYEKCSDFWTFVASEPLLQKMIVLPEPFSVECKSASSTEEQTLAKPLEKPEEKGAIDFLPGLCLSGFKLAPKYCDEYPGSYDDGYHLKTNEVQHSSRSQEQPSKITKEGVLESALRQTCEKFLNTSPRHEVRELCALMENFDKKHPKSMEPPGHAPPLTHAILQRCPRE